MAFRSTKLRAVSPGPDGAPSSALRAFALLERIAAADEPPTLEELTRATGLPKPTVYRILRLLTRGGLVERQRLLGPGPLARYTERTIVSFDALERELAKVHATGVATDAGEFLDGSVCLAVPVRDPRGRMCAAIAVHGPAPRMTLKRGYAFLPALREAAQAIAAMLVPAGASVPAPLRKTHSARTKRIAA